MKGYVTSKLILRTKEIGPVCQGTETTDITNSSQSATKKKNEKYKIKNVLTIGFGYSPKMKLNKLKVKVSLKSFENLPFKYCTSSNNANKKIDLHICS